jgi:putative flippase GtrA
MSASTCLAKDEGMPKNPQMRPWPARLLAAAPAGQMARFLGVGVWNTVFGYGSYALLAYGFGRLYPTYGYLLAALVSSVLSISVAFLGYKWLVFKTQGNYLHEWMRFLVVYGSSILLGLLLLPLLVFAIRHTTRVDAGAPYIAAAIVACLNAIFNFAGNKSFTFR